ncbi:Mur ligase family protein [Pasteurella atlantica]|uniref:Mur ligase family protein n=2 Tax=Pasteurellaceae TaxID=712 RepID=A0ACC6HN73_9PAST|nr:Mur ligase family protein [Pasteurella atlantica]MDP8052297.1 Mur ligase family protein [Pasteurella atlantica]MDP8101764.1 Mur ligase family protein [Pasteurella atlantica]MDP8105793.1 Mur ligase family protein [Pasteurella atlantica]MDP8149142.1 Mur ligase family protein [Pasteurella atlantica]
MMSLKIIIKKTIHWLDRKLGLNMNKITIAELFEVIGMEIPGNFLGSKNHKLENISYVPSHIKKGGAFFCGEKYTRNINVDEFMKEILKYEPKIIFVTKQQYDKLTIDGPFVMVYYMYEKVVKVTRYLKNQYKARTVAITGSLGKTTTKDMIYNVLGKSFYLIKSFDNENTIGYLLKNVQRLNDKQEFLIHEFGVDIPTIMPRTASGANPEACVITNISEPHLDTFKTYEAILVEKLDLAKKMTAGSPVFLNYDDERLKNSQERLKRYKIISVGINNKEVDYYAQNITHSDGGIDFEIVNHQKCYPIRLNVRGEYNIYNALISFAIGDYYGMPIKKITEGIAEFQPSGIRQSLVNIGGYNVYLDAYNTAPKSLLSSVDIIEKLEVKERGRKIAILADMARLGEHSEKLHKEVGEKLSDKKIDVVYCYGNENAKTMADNISNSDIEVHYTENRDTLNEWIKNNLSRDDVILFKGPVNRLLTKTIDMMFGSSYHIRSEHFEYNTVDNFRYKLIYESENRNAKTLALHTYLGQNKNITVPEQYKNLSLFGMSPRCFAENKTIEEIVLPDSMRNISRAAFRGCSNLKKIKLPLSLNVIEINAFRECRSLERVEIPYGTTHIDDNVFTDCVNLKQVIIPDTVEYFGNNIFKGCPNVEFKYLTKDGLQDYLENGNDKITFLVNSETGELEVVSYDDKALTLNNYKNIVVSTKEK